MLDFLSTVLYLSKKDIYNLKSSFVFPTIANASSDRLQCLLHGLLVRTPCQVPWRKRRCQASLKRRVQRRFISIEMVLVVMSRPQSFNPNGWNICWVMHVESGGQGQGTDKLLFPRKNGLQNQGETWLEKLLLNLMVAPKKHNNWGHPKNDQHEDTLVINTPQVSPNKMKS